MFEKTIKYTDWNGEEHEGKFNFHLTRTEMLKLNTKYPGGLVPTLNKYLKEENENQILLIFDDIIRASYGEMSADGVHFEKAKGAKAEAFSETGAYDALFVELLSDTGKLSEFLNKIMPKDIAAKVEEMKTDKESSNAIALPVNSSATAVTIE